MDNRRFLTRVVARLQDGVGMNSGYALRCRLRCDARKRRSSRVKERTWVDVGLACAWIAQLCVVSGAAGGPATQSTCALPAAEVTGAQALQCGRIIGARSLVVPLYERVPDRCVERGRRTCKPVGATQVGGIVAVAKKCDRWGNVSLPQIVGVSGDTRGGCSRTWALDAQQDRVAVEDDFAELRRQGCGSARRLVKCTTTY